MDDHHCQHSKCHHQLHRQGGHNRAPDHSPSRWPFWRLWLTALLAMLLATPAHAKRLALVLGNAAYQGQAVLANPVNDATDVAQTLKSLGLQVFENKAHTNLTRQGMNNLVGRFLAAAEGAELALVYYAGHGMQSANNTYLLPTDASITDDRSVRSEGLGLNDLLDDSADRRISRLVVILDACRDNPFSTRTRSATRGLARPKETNGTLIAYATADGQVANDGSGRNGVYTDQLLKQLRQHGQRKSIRDLLEDTQLAVANATAQRPKVYGDTALFRDVGLTGPVQFASLTVEPAARPAQTDPEQDAWDLAKRRDTATAYQAYLNAYPNGRYAAAARVALQGLQPATQSMQAAQPAQGPQLAPQELGSVQRRSFEPEMVKLPEGSFLMGSPASEPGRNRNEGPQRRVTLKTFAFGKTEVTQGQWKAVMGSNPSRFNQCGDNCPVENVSWNEVQAYIRKLNQMTGKNYRLPSEAEWEYAARAGCESAFNVGGRCAHKIEVSEANYNGSFTHNGSAMGAFRDTTTVVGSFKANNWGLSDTHGNVHEWVQDCWEDSYEEGQPTDGSAHRGDDGACGLRVHRGGSWSYTPQHLRAAYRFGFSPASRHETIGFRLARTLPQ